LLFGSLTSAQVSPEEDEEVSCSVEEDVGESGTSWLGSETPAEGVPPLGLGFRLDRDDELAYLTKAETTLFRDAKDMGILNFTIKVGISVYEIPAMCAWYLHLLEFIQLLCVRK